MNPSSSSSRGGVGGRRPATPPYYPDQSSIISQRLDLAPSLPPIVGSSSNSNSNSGNNCSAAATDCSISNGQVGYIDSNGAAPANKLGGSVGGGGVESHLDHSNDRLDFIY